jgi:hypothetical protein
MTPDRDQELTTRIKHRIADIIGNRYALPDFFIDNTRVVIRFVDDELTITAEDQTWLVTLLPQTK